MTRVLIIDDEPNLTRLLKLTLERLGRYEVRTADTGLGGIAVAREFNPHVVVLDIVLPDISGGEVGAALGDTPMVFLTALVQSERSMAGRTVLAKPVKFDALVSRLDLAIRQASALPVR